MSTIPIIGASNAHVITGSDAPTVDALRDPKNNWGIIGGDGGVKYLARIGSADDALGLIRLDDPFFYVSAPNAERRGSEVRINFVRNILPVEGWGGISKIAVKPTSVILLAELGKAETAILRELLVGAWEGRKHLRRLDSSIAEIKK